MCRGESLFFLLSSMTTVSSQCKASRGGTLALGESELHHRGVCSPPPWRVPLLFRWRWPSCVLASGRFEESLGSSVPNVAVSMATEGLSTSLWVCRRGCAATTRSHHCIKVPLVNIWTNVWVCVVFICCRSVRTGKPCWLVSHIRPLLLAGPPDAAQG